MIFHATENIILLIFFFLRTEILSFPFLKISCKPRKCYGKIIFLPTSCVENGFLLPPEIHSIKFFFILKFISSFFLLNMNFPFAQRPCFYNNFFLLSWKLISFNHFKTSRTILITRQNAKLNQRTVFL